MGRVSDPPFIVGTENLQDQVIIMPQTVLVTGANRGFGLEFARQYAERGRYGAQVELGLPFY